MDRAPSQSYLVALGSNRRHHLYGAPRQILHTAMEELAALGTVVSRSPIITTPPMGPAQRHFANAAVLIVSEYDPDALLAGLKQIESEFGRRRWRRWGDRVLDLDIALWSGGAWRSDTLTIPHRGLSKRSFVLGPAKAIAPLWRDPETGLSVSQLFARLTKPRPTLR